MDVCLKKKAERRILRSTSVLAVAKLLDRHLCS